MINVCVSFATTSTKDYEVFLDLLSVWLGRINFGYHESDTSNTTDS